MRGHFRGLALALMLPMGVWGAMQAQGPAPTGAPRPDAPPGSAEAAPASAASDRGSAVEPKPITPSVKKGLDWLVEHQLKDGGWGQGDESQQMGGGGELRDKPNVADTCIAALALIRSGSTPSSGPYKDAVARAVGFVRSHVEASDSESLAVSTVQGTRVQMKLGPNIDTFLASLLLAEVKDRMTGPDANKAVEVSLNKVLGKIKKHQKADGSWDNAAGWAPILAQSMAGKGINRASQNGAAVAPELLARTEGFARYQLAQASAPVAAEPAAVISADAYGGGRADPVAVAKTASPVAAPVTFAGVSDLSTRSSRAFSPRSGGLGSAGVELYDRASSLSVLQDSVNTNAAKEPELKKLIETSKDEKKVAEARTTLERFKVATLACSEAQTQVIARLDDKGFLAGFGSNGGEEFLSYMNIGESLVLKGGPAWQRWDEAMTANLNRIQNDDGSWTGHHCITGRTFCTSTALLVLLGDRTPVPSRDGEKTAVR